jgi:hypothetical protein
MNRHRRAARSSERQRMATEPSQSQYDLRTLCPEQRAAWEEAPDGRVVLLRPKFTHPLLVRWLLPLLRQKHFRIKLDDAGSFLWKAADGRTTVEVIGQRMASALKMDPDSVLPRIAAFLQQLEREQFIVVHKP